MQKAFDALLPSTGHLDFCSLAMITLGNGEFSSSIQINIDLFQIYFKMYFISKSISGLCVPEIKL